MLALTGPLLKVRWVGSFASTKYREYFRHRQWGVGLVEAPIHRFLEPGFRPEVHWVHPPGRDQYLADPFGLVQDGHLRVLCENYHRMALKGSLQAFDWPLKGDRPVLRGVLPSPTHVSYPYLFQDGGRACCVPETSAAGEVALYQAESFPDRWRKVAPLLEGFPGVDSTVFRFDGRWWLATTHREDPDRKLYLWYADNLLGPWNPHAKNPVKDDVASARPAGTPFVWEGSLYRPAQDCSKTYGGRVAVNRVDALSPDTFREEVVSYVEPDRHGPYPLGLHTLSSVGDATLLDGFRNVFSRTAFRQKIAARRSGGRAAG